MLLVFVFVFVVAFVFVLAFAFVFVFAFAFGFVSFAVRDSRFVSMEKHCSSIKGGTLLFMNLLTPVSVMPGMDG